LYLYQLSSSLLIITDTRIVRTFDYSNNLAFIVIGLAVMGFVGPSCSSLFVESDSPSGISEDAIDAASRAGVITVGMSTDDVVGVWGQPSKIETAGNPLSGNQKWIYSNGLSDRWALKSPRVVYFESKRVVGWDVPETY
jgi:hypothetical protein